MRKFKAMTNREWIAKHHPNKINDDSYGGVVGCPDCYNLQIMCRPSLSPCDEYSCKCCWDCLAKIDGKYIMKEVK